MLPDNWIPSCCNSQRSSYLFYCEFAGSGSVLYLFCDLPRVLGGILPTLPLLFADPVIVLFMGNVLKQHMTHSIHHLLQVTQHKSRFCVVGEEGGGGGGGVGSRGGGSASSICVKKTVIITLCRPPFSIYPPNSPYFDS